MAGLGKILRSVGIGLGRGRASKKLRGIAKANKEELKWAVPYHKKLKEKLPVARVHAKEHGWPASAADVHYAAIGKEIKSRRPSVASLKRRYGAKKPRKDTMAKTTRFAYHGEAVPHLALIGRHPLSAVGSTLKNLARRRAFDAGEDIGPPVVMGGKLKTSKWGISESRHSAEWGGPPLRYQDPPVGYDLDVLQIERHMGDLAATKNTFKELTKALKKYDKKWGTTKYDPSQVPRQGRTLKEMKDIEYDWYDILRSGPELHRYPLKVVSGKIPGWNLRTKANYETILLQEGGGKAAHMSSRLRSFKRVRAKKRVTKAAIIGGAAYVATRKKRKKK